MPRSLKILLWLVGTLVALVIAAVVIVPLVVDPNDYRDDIAALVEKHTGRELTIDGDLDLSVFPWLGLEIGQVQLGNAAGFAEGPFARIEEAQVRVQLLPLLRSEVLLDTLVLDGLRLHLARNAEGVGNWEDLTAAPAAPPAPPADQPSQPEGGAPAIGALAIGGLVIQDASVTWDDAASGQQAEISDLVLESGAIELGKPFPLELALAFSASEPQLRGTLELNARVSADPNRARYRLDEAVMELTAAGPTLPGGELAAQLATALQADLTAGTARVERLHLAALGAEVEATLEASAITSAPAASGDLRATLTETALLLGLLAPDLVPQIRAEGLDGSALSTSLRLDLGAGTLHLPDLMLTLPGAKLSAEVSAERLTAQPRAAGTMELAVSDGAKLLAPFAGLAPEGLDAARLSGAGARAGYTVDLAEQSAAVTDLGVEALGLALRGAARVSGLAAQPVTTLELASDEFVPRDVAAALGIALPEAADPSVFGKAVFDVVLQASPDRLQVERLQATLDQTELGAAVTVSRFDAPIIRYRLAIGELDADRYLPPPAEDGQPAPVPATPGSAAGAAATQLPVELMRSLDVDGSLTVSALKAANLRSRDISAVLRGQKGKFRLHPVQAKLYQGSYNGDLRLDVSGETPMVAMNEKLNGIQAGPLLTDFMGEAPISGSADLAATLTARGLDPEPVKRSLNGTASFRFADGVVQGINVAHLIRTAYAKIKGEPAPPEEPEQTDFAEIKGSVRIADGVVDNRDLTAKTPLLRVEGAGSVNLVEETIDYTVKAAVVATLKGQGGADLEELKGLTIPLSIEGALASPDIGIALDDVLQARLDAEKAKIEEKARKELEAEKDKLKGKLQEGLKGLFR